MLLFGALPGGADAQELRTVSGTVCRTTATPCEPATGVFVTLQPIGQITQTSHVDGTFAVTGVPPGEYSLSVSECEPTLCYQPTRVTLGATNVNVRVDPCTDTDDDMMCTVWESARPCVNASVPDNLNDSDGDGLPNLLEYDFGSNPCSIDTDGDGCSDFEETDFNPALGGDRNLLERGDWFDVNNDRLIDLGDALVILQHFGHGPNNDPTDNNLDRYASEAAKPWRTRFADDGVDLGDALVALTSFGHDCRAAP
jgi:hypothetical protein